MNNRWGHATDLAIANFPVSGEPVPRELIHALVMLKSEAAAVNAEMGVISAAVAAAIRQAAAEILDGEMADQFPVDVFQTGSGTSTNMNINEVIAHRASELLTATVHPNDHVNASQSSNDTFPSATRVSACIIVVQQLAPALTALAASLRKLEARHVNTVKMGRTHLMDAVPMTFGQECSAWAAAVDSAAARILGVLPSLCELPIGGTAVGTGLNAPAKFGAAVAQRMSAMTGVRFVESSNHFEAQATQDAIVETSGMFDTSTDDSHACDWPQPAVIAQAAHQRHNNFRFSMCSRD
jgi:fumarate hydratase, class II